MYYLVQMTKIGRERLQSIRSGASSPTPGELAAIERVLPGISVNKEVRLHVVRSTMADSEAAEELYREWAAALLRKSRKDFLATIPTELHPAIVILSETFAGKILGKKEDAVYRVFESKKKRLRHVIVRSSVVEGSGDVHFEYVGQSGYGRSGADGVGFVNKPVLRSTFESHYREVDLRIRDAVLSEARALGEI